MSWNTMHIFGYGQDQLISNTENKLVDKELCPSTQEVVDMVYSHKPADNPTTLDYRSINIFHDLFADVSDNERNTFRVEYSELDSALINALVTEVENA